MRSTLFHTKYPFQCEAVISPYALLFTVPLTLFETGERSRELACLLTHCGDSSGSSTLACFSGLFDFLTSYLLHLASFPFISVATECSSLLECNENPVLSGLLHATASRCTPGAKRYDFNEVCLQFVYKRVCSKTCLQSTLCGCDFRESCLQLCVSSGLRVFFSRTQCHFPLVSSEACLQ